MPKPLNLNKTATLVLMVLLLLSCFTSALTFTNGQQPSFPTQPIGSAAEIASLEVNITANGGWNSSLQTIYDGITLGQTTVADLQDAVDSVNITSTSAAETVFYWYFELSKFGVPINATTIEAALNETAMLPGIGGLPDDYSNSGTASFLVYERYDLFAYRWADQLGYETSKWNLTQAYTVFNKGVADYGKPVLCVGSNGQGWGISYGPRYYDESAETIDIYLTFWLLGVSDALSQAQYWWNWVSANLWDTTGYPLGSFYKYALDWTAFECEAGSFDQIISKLYYYDPTISNMTNLYTDVETRWLSQNWSSPGWLNYVSVHATGVGSGGGNSQERLENTISAWAAMIGFYGNMTSTMQSQVDGMLDGSTGPAPAWSLLFQSELYDNFTGMFMLQSSASDSIEATADAAVLIMLLSTVPVNGSLAVPMADSWYEDINNIIDGGISNINYTSQTVTVSVAQPGTFLSMFGTNIFEYNLDSSGVWQLTFSNDWNSIISETLLTPLPSSRIYLGTTNVGALTIFASNDGNSTINPSGIVSINYGGNQTFTYSADGGYTINQVLVNGFSVPITGNYTFTDVQMNQTISVSSSPVPIPTPSPTPLPSSTPTPSPTPFQSPLPTPSPTQNPSPIPTLSPTASPTPSPTQTPTSSPTLTPTSTSAPSKSSSSLLSIPLPEFLGVLIFVAAVLFFSMLMLYVKSRKNGLAIEKKQL